MTKHLALRYGFPLCKVAEYLAGQAEMTRERKLTKYILSIALQTNNSVAGAARYLGVNRRTVQRSIKYFGLDRVAPTAPIESHSSRIAALAEPASTNGATKLEAKSHSDSTPPPKKAERNVLRLTAADFSGRCVGNAQPNTGIRENADKLVLRYHRLRAS